MQTLKERHGTTASLQAMRVLHARLAPYEEAAELRAELAAAARRLEEARSRFEETLAERVAATQRLVYRDTLLDEAVMRLSRTMLARLDGDRRHRRYQAVFVRPPSLAMRTRGGEAQKAFVQAVVQAARADEEASRWGELLDAIEAAQRELDRAAEERTARRAEEQEARRKLLQALQDARQQYNACYLKLRLMWPDERALVESFFPVLRNRSREPEELDEPAAGD